MPVDIGLRIKTLFSPDDDTQAAFLAFIQGTQKRLRIAVYGMHLPPLVDSLLALHEAGRDVALVLDHTQAEGTYERPEVAQIIAAGVPVRIGSSERHHIMHHKFAVRDGAAVLSGSWNFSESASLESNYFDIVDNPERAALFEAKWEEMWTWIDAHEAKWNPEEAAPPVS